MRIGIDGRFWNESGVGRYIRNLVENLSGLDTKNEYVLFLSQKSQIKNLKLSKNWEIVRTDVKWHSVGEQIKFPILLHKYRLDLVHFPYFSIPIFYRKPYVVTIHDLIIHHFSTGKASTLPLPLYHVKRLGYKFVLSQAARNAKQIITVSQATKQEIIDHLNIDQKKISVTYEGIDRKFIKKSARSRTNKQPYFLYVGNAYPHKNLETMFHAFSMLPDTKVALYVVGQDDYFLRQMKHVATQTYKNPNIKFLKGVTDEELSKLYANAICLVSPSLMEGFGLPVLEAMHAGCLVIASDIPSFREICNDAAVYFDPYDTDALFQKMKDVLENPGKYDSHVAKGLKRAKDFSWRKMSEETLSIYKKSVTI